MPQKRTSGRPITSVATLKVLIYIHNHPGTWVYAMKGDKGILKDFTHNFLHNAAISLENMGLVASKKEKPTAKRGIQYCRRLIHVTEEGRQEVAYWRDNLLDSLQEAQDVSGE